MNCKKLIVLIWIFHSIGLTYQLPDPTLTPGAVCTPDDPDFKGYDYPSKVARCNRNIGAPEKQKVAASYGNIPVSEWKNYEFDHYLPLCAGGSNSSENLWPQPLAEAHIKDGLEVQICTALKAGTLTQSEALQKVHDWFKEIGKSQQLPEPAPIVVTPSLQPADHKNIVCIESAANKKTDQLMKLSFSFLNPTHITNLLVTLIEPGKENELINTTDQILMGRLSQAKSEPLQGLTLFSVQNKNDKFNIYIGDVSTDAPEFDAYFKIAFEDSYPKLVHLICHQE